MADEYDPNLPAGDSSSPGAYIDPAINVAVDERFQLQLNAAKIVVWGVLLLCTAIYAIRRRYDVSRAWKLFHLLIGVLALTFLESVMNEVYLLVNSNGYQAASENIWLVCIFVKDAASTAFLKCCSHCGNLLGVETTIPDLMFLVYFNMASSALSMWSPFFLLVKGVLLVLASGFCITRSDFGPHASKVYWVPIIVLGTGLISDYIYYELQDKVSDDAYAISDMTQLEMTVWFVCSVINLVTLVMAWVYTFDILQQEMLGLDAAQKVLQGPEPTPAPPPDDLERGEHRGSQQQQNISNSAHATLLPSSYVPSAYAEERKLSSQLTGGVGPDGEILSDEEAGARARAGAGECETVADRLAFSIKRQLLGRFALGVAAYVLGTILVVLLPVFINITVQKIIKILQLVINFGFLAALIWIFRPAYENPYLMVGLSEADADDGGVGNLSTEVAMTELDGSMQRQLDEDEDEDDLNAITQHSQMNPYRQGLPQHNGNGQQQGGRWQQGANSSKPPVPGFYSSKNGNNGQHTSTTAAGSGSSLPVSTRALTSASQGSAGSASDTSRGASTWQQQQPSSSAAASKPQLQARVGPPPASSSSIGSGIRTDSLRGLQIKTLAAPGTGPAFTIAGEEAEDDGGPDLMDLDWKNAMAAGAAAAAAAQAAAKQR